MCGTKGKGLQRLIAVALVFVMVFAQCFCAADVYAEGDAVCKVTVAVKDKDTGEEIENAEVIFTQYDRSGDDYPVLEGVTRNEDGTYNVPYNSEDLEWGVYYRYYGTAPGYKDSRTLNKYSGILQGERLTIEGDSVTVSDILLEKLPASERLQGAISDAQTEIENYLNKDDYDSDQQAEIEEIIKKYQDRIDAEIEVGEETEETATAKIEALNEIVAAAKEELDAVNTSQENINEEYVDDICFLTSKGEVLYFEREDYGKFSITLHRFTKGTFKVSGNDEDTDVIWNAKKEMFYQSAGNVVPFEIIDNTYVKGEFLGSKAIAPTVDLNQAVGTIRNCSVTYTKNGKKVNVTFDLTITDESIEALKAALAEAIAGKKEAEKIAADALAALKIAEEERDAALAAKAEAEAERDAALAAKEEALAAKAAAEKARDTAVAAQKAAEKARDAAIKTSISGLSLTVKAGTKKAYLSWNRKSNADGYIIYRSTSKNSGYVKIKTIKSNSTVKYTNYNLKSNKTYYYKIRAYKGSVYGTYSAAKYVRTR